MQHILNFVYNHAAPRHCLNKFRHCSRLAVYFMFSLVLPVYMSVHMFGYMSVYMPSGDINPEEQSPEGIYTDTDTDNIYRTISIAS